MRNCFIIQNIGKVQGTTQLLSNSFPNINIFLVLSSTFLWFITETYNHFLQEVLQIEFFVAKYVNFWKKNIFFYIILNQLNFI